MKIGNVLLDNNLILAPLAGFTDVGFRKVCKKYGVGLTCTEMISGKGLFYNNSKTKEMLVMADCEDKIAVQLFGNNPNILAKAVSNPDLQIFDIIDVNMGCPVQKVVSNGEGSAMLKDIKNAAEVVRAMKENTDKPLTVKFRIGYKAGEDIAVDFGLAMQDAGADAVTVHGRTREQFYNGVADWDAIARVKKALKIPVIANGDIVSVKEYERCRAVTGADGFMIGRGALGHPWLFAEILGRECTDNAKIDILEHIAEIEKYSCQKVVVNSMKKHICYYAKGRENSRSIKTEVCAVESLSELITLVERFFK